jgi:hypothetical protein
MKILALDNPSFLICVAICGLSAVYLQIGSIDYFPALETCRVATYPLLACGIMTFVMRPRSRFARWGLMVSLLLSAETVGYLFYRAGWPLSDLLGWLGNRVSGYWRILKLTSPIFSAAGIPDELSYLPFQLVVTGAVYSVCSLAFRPLQWWKAAIWFACSYLIAFAILVTVVVSIRSFVLGELAPTLHQLMFTALFWHFLPRVGGVSTSSVEPQPENPQ